MVSRGSTLSFEHPHALWLLLSLPILWLSIQRHRISISHPRLLQLPNALQKKWSMSSLVIFLPLPAALCLIVAIATPVRIIKHHHENKEGISIEMLLDVSSSMDINTTLGSQKKTRMEVAKTVLKEFIIGDGESLAGRPDDLIGVITFSRYADTLCPLTHSHEAIASIIDDVEVNERPNEDGTAYGDATGLAAALLQQFSEHEHQSDEVKSKIIVLLTDGENNCGRYLPLQAAAMAKAWGIRIYTISLGDPPDTQTLKSEGLSIQTQQGFSEAEWGLKQLADSTGGFFGRAHNYKTLKGIYLQINELETSQLSSRTIEKREPASRPWVMAAMIFLVLSPSLSILGWRTST
jgi:Ca-activated chloride channel family protein